jgi:hypothetical protein
MTRMTKLRLAIGMAAALAGLVLGVTGRAHAGLAWNWPVGVSGTSPNSTGSGSMTDGRFGGNPNDYIGCFYNTGSNSIECDAQQDMGNGVVKRITCTTYSPSTGMVIAVAGLNAASVLTFTTASGGVCKSIQIWNESDYL